MRALGPVEMLVDTSIDRYTSTSPMTPHAQLHLDAGLPQQPLDPKAFRAVLNLYLVFPSARL